MICISYENKLSELGFPIGTRVILAVPDPYDYVKCGQVGTVCHYFNLGDGCDVGVSWDEESHGFHNCSGHCENGHGRYVPHTNLQLEDFDLGEIEVSDCSIATLFDTTS